MSDGKAYVEELQYKLSMLLKIHAIWFFLAAFPSFILIFSYGACVTFQGTYPAIDFLGTQLLFILITPGLVNPRFLNRLGYLRYYKWVALIGVIVQIGAFSIHLYGLTHDGAILRNFTSCFQVDVGGIWYTLAANLGGSIGLFLQFIIIQNLIIFNSSCYLRRVAEIEKSIGIPVR